MCFDLHSRLAGMQASAEAERIASHRRKTDLKKTVDAISVLIDADHFDAASSLADVLVTKLEDM